MIMKGERIGLEVVRFFRSQQKQEKSVRLLGMKVLLKQYDRNADEVSKYIEVNYPQYTAHAKENSKDKLSISHRKLEPIDDYVSNNKEVCNMVIALFEAQKRKVREIELLSIKVLLPEWADAEEISSYILVKYPNQYKVHSKDQGEYPIVAIGKR